MKKAPQWKMNDRARKARSQRLFRRVTALKKQLQALSNDFAEAFTVGKALLPPTAVDVIHARNLAQAADRLIPVINMHP